MDDDQRENEDGGSPSDVARPAAGTDETPSPGKPKKDLLPDTDLDPRDPDSAGNEDLREPGNSARD